MPTRIPDEREIAIYKAYLDDLGRLGGRHETLRAFYLTLVSALATLLGLTSSTGPLSGVRDDVQLSVAAVGLLIAVLWSAHMRSFGIYFRAKRTVLSELEDGWSIAPFTKETAQTPKRFYRVTYVDQLIAIAFMIFFVSLALVRFPI